MTQPTQIRQATPADLPALADLWYQGWQEAHAAHVPAELTAQRSHDSFFTRLQNLPNTHILGPTNAPLGLCVLRNNEVYQFYVSPAARGTGTAQILIAFGEAGLHAAGHEVAQLEVIPQNLRAIAFYEKAGWVKQGIETILLDTLGEPFPLPCQIMTKRLR